MVDSITRATWGGNNWWCIFAVEILDGAHVSCDTVGVAADICLIDSPGKRVIHACEGNQNP